MLYELSFIFVISWASLYLFRKLAWRVGLVDKPNKRKHHNATTPLVGGLSVGTSLLIFMLTSSNLNVDGKIFSFCICVLLVCGVIDDKFDISFKVRLFIQGGLALILVYFSGLELRYLGDILGLGVLTFENLGGIITIIAVIAAINAFNMIDGIDGLLGGLALVTFGSFGLSLLYLNYIQLSYLCLVFCVILFPYILFNLGIFGKQRKVFMGDAGSMVIGFSVIWIALISTQQDHQILRPVTVLWFIAIPLVDMGSIIIRRIRKGNSPFKPDREHLHHIFLRLGYTSKQTLVIICFLAFICSLIGILGQLFNVAESIVFTLFIVFFILYNQCLTHVWTITSYLRKQH